jgi:hypothetical protein
MKKRRMTALDRAARAADERVLEWIADLERGISVDRIAARDGVAAVDVAAVTGAVLADLRAERSGGVE